MKTLMTETKDYFISTGYLDGSYYTQVYPFTDEVVLGARLPAFYRKPHAEYEWDSESAATVGHYDLINQYGGELDGPNVVSNTRSSDKQECN